MINYENIDICKNCGGECCKSCGCSYMSSDFLNVNYNYLNILLSNGYISIYWPLYYIYKNPNKIFLSLRARNVDRPIIDLVSTPNTCLALKENGCMYSYADRPSGGKNLIPRWNKGCYYSISPHEIHQTWKPYQKILRKLVIKYTGNTPEKMAAQDIEKFLYQTFNNDLVDAKMLEVINKTTFPIEYENAYKKKILQIK